MSDDRTAPTPPPGTGRRLLLGRQLLDRQIVDRDGRLAGKVDDVEITLPGETGTEAEPDHDPDATPDRDVRDVSAVAERPTVTALLSGRQALSRRIGGRVGAIAYTLSRRILPDPDEADSPAGDGRIWFGRVTDLGNHVTIADRASDLATDAVEEAVRKTFIDRIPGAKEPGA
jgi:hypothetical protein